MRVLVACEYSGIVRDAFLKRGHDAMSCDLHPGEGNGPHYQGDVFDVINDGWDLMIAHPPCTHLAVSGARHFEQKRNDGRQKEAIEFFMELFNAPIDKVAVENPVNIISGNYIKKWFPELCDIYGLPIKSNQIIQPWQFGDPYQKTTCLWMKNLPLLTSTEVVDKGEFIIYESGRKLPKWYAEKFGKGEERSRFWEGIAEAMADQWGGVNK